MLRGLAALLLIVDWYLLAKQCMYCMHLLEDRSSAHSGIPLSHVLSFQAVGIAPTCTLFDSVDWSLTPPHSLLIFCCQLVCKHGLRDTPCLACRRNCKSSQAKSWKIEFVPCTCTIWCLRVCHISQHWKNYTIMPCQCIPGRPEVTSTQWGCYSQFFFCFGFWLLVQHASRPISQPKLGGQAGWPVIQTVH